MKDSVIELVNKAMLWHVENISPFLDDKDHEKWYSKYHLHYSEQASKDFNWTPQKYDEMDI